MILSIFLYEYEYGLLKTRLKKKIKTYKNKTKKSQKKESKT